MLMNTTTLLFDTAAKDRRNPIHRGIDISKEKRSTCEDKNQQLTVDAEKDCEKARREPRQMQRRAAPKAPRGVPAPADASNRQGHAHRCHLKQGREPGRSRHCCGAAAVQKYKGDESGKRPRVVSALLNIHGRSLSQWRRKCQRARKYWNPVFCSGFDFPFAPLLQCRGTSVTTAAKRGSERPYSSTASSRDETQVYRLFVWTPF